MKIFKKNQVIIFVIALMLMTAGYLNYTNQNINSNLLPTSGLADSEQIAEIGDATLVNANQISKDVESADKNKKVSENDKTADINNQVQANNNKNTIENNDNFNTESVLVENESKTQDLLEDNYFAQSRLDRDNMYSQMIANYQKILETDNLSSKEKETAQTEIKKINNEKNAIMVAENLIKTKGFSDIVIFVNNGNVTGVIKAEKIDEAQIAQIQNIITRELNANVKKINISCKK